MFAFLPKEVSIVFKSFKTDCGEEQPILYISYIDLRSFSIGGFYQFHFLFLA